ALPQLTTTLFGESDEMPKVSPGHTDGSPPADVICRSVTVGSLSVPGRVQGAGRVHGDIAVNPPFRQRHRSGLGAYLERRGPGVSAVDGRCEIAVRGVQGVGRGVGDLVALVEQVNSAARLHHKRCAVSAARRKPRAYMHHRAERPAAIVGLLHHDIQVTGPEGTA